MTAMLPQPTSRLIIADPQDITRYAVTVMAERLQLFVAISEVGTFDELIGRLRDDDHAVCVLDYTLLDITEERLLVAAERFRKVRFVLLCETLTPAFIKRMAFASRSFSIVMKSSSVIDIRKALQTAAKGGRFLCDYAHAAISREREFDATSPLTPTERDILREIAFGLTSKQIAEKRSLSPYTVVTHRKNIFRKLGVNNAQEAVRYALRAGIAVTAEYYI